MEEISPFPRTYVRSGVYGLTLEEQEAALAIAGIETHAAYVDKLTKAAITRRDPASLKARAEMLRVPPRAVMGRICVADCRVLGWSFPDICRTIAAAWRDSNASVYVVNARWELLPSMSAGDLLDVLGLMYDERIAADRLAIRHAGVEAAAEKRRRLRSSKLVHARRLWVLPQGEISAKEIAATVGLSVRTLHTYLGDRAAARRGMTQ